jgi:hypothetical protein
MRLRPHHLLDILNKFGHGLQFTPHPYGHALHTVAAQVLADLDLEVEFVLGADAICQPCRYLQPDGLCADVLRRLPEMPSKQAYNDALDQRLFTYLQIEPGARMTVRAFIERLNAHVPGIEAICTHPGEKQEERLRGLQEGLRQLGFRKS